jgi:hypothetical protein
VVVAPAPAPVVVERRTTIVTDSPSAAVVTTVDPWCAGRHDPGRGTNFGTCPGGVEIR